MEQEPEQGGVLTVPRDTDPSAIPRMIAGTEPGRYAPAERLVEVGERTSRSLAREVGKTGRPETKLLRTSRTMLGQAIQALRTRTVDGAMPKITVREDRALRFLLKVVKEFRFDGPNGPCEPMIDLTRFDSDTIRMFFLEAKRRPE